MEMSLHLSYKSRGVFIFLRGRFCGLPANWPTVSPQNFTLGLLCPKDEIYLTTYKYSDVIADNTFRYLASFRFL